MNIIIDKSAIKQWLFTLLLFVTCLESFSQPDIGRQSILKFDLNNSVFKADAPFLKESVPMIKGRNSNTFVIGVGGVSFDKVSLPENNLKISSLKLNYNRNAADGSRLELLINDKPVKIDLPDWMLVPIANYAGSPYYSCVTLFGKLNDTALEKLVTDNKGRVINYHPALDNTLLGIRLAYMDMLVGYNFTVDLPKNNLEKYILGKGETKPDLTANTNGAYNLSQHIIRTENKYKYTFRSYIITDYSRQIGFKLLHDSLVISGYPYYFCWKLNSDREDYDINLVAKELSSKYNRKIKDLSESAGNTTASNWLIEKLIYLGGKYEGNFGFYSDGTFNDMVRLKTNAEKKEFLGKYAPESLFEMVVNTEAYMNRDSVIYLKGLSDDISSVPQLFQAANPAVWNATVNTMRFAAFFRFVKLNYPKTWLAFLDQIKTVDPEPGIITPTIMYDPASKELQKAINNLRK